MAYALRSAQKEVFYHYTTPQSAEDIIRSGLLIKSSRGPGKNDAAFGDGVYLTKIPPTQQKHQIALNNWDGGVGNAQMLVRLGRVNACIRLELKSADVTKVHDPNGRDIYLYPGDLRITTDMNPQGYYIK